MIKYILTFIVVVAVSIFYFVSQYQDIVKNATPAIETVATSTPPEPVVVASLMYVCDNNLALNAVYYDVPKATVATSEGIPTPTGYVTLTLPAARTLSLNQTISASGVRYSNADESIIFFNKGNEAIFTEVAVTPDEFTNCIAVAVETATQTNIYHDGTVGFTVRYPETYTVDATHAYAIGGGKTIPGVSFTIADTMATGTNLSGDSYIAIESAKLSDTGTCEADRFLTVSATSTAVVLGNDVTYSVASSSDAGVGNRYEETVYARPSMTSCLIMRSFVHYTAIENYPKDTVEQFDIAALQESFDEIRDSLTVR